jgi:hypothetical protein
VDGSSAACGNGIALSGKRHEEEGIGCQRRPYLQSSVGTRRLIPTSANNIDTDGAAARVGFICYAKIVQVLSNSDRRVMFDPPIFGVIYRCSVIGALNTELIGAADQGLGPLTDG